MEVFTLNIYFNHLDKWEQLLVASNAEFANLKIFEALETVSYQDFPFTNFQINMFKFYKKMYELSIRYNIEWTCFYSESLSLSEIYANYIVKSKKKINIDAEIDNQMVYRILNMSFDKKRTIEKSEYFKSFYVSHTFNTNF
jgi:hypothetical protein